MTSLPCIGPVSQTLHLAPQEFIRNYYKPATPVIIRGTLNWRAFTTWSHEWFRDTFGWLLVNLSVNPTHTRRVVRMRLDTYITRILTDNRMEGGLYLDQFPLDELPDLRRDFSIPEYCPKDRKLFINLWLGPGTTVLGFHKDNHNPITLIDNVFVQIHGRKRILLASPDNDDFMYPRTGTDDAYWHSQVDPDNPDVDRFPAFRNARLQEAIVEPGDLLYIPRDHWHYVRALEKSISLSFWWHPCRFMEVAGELAQHSPRGQRLPDVAVSAADLAEIGGVSFLRQALSSHKDREGLITLLSSIGLLAEPPVRHAIEGVIAETTQDSQRP